MTQFPAADKNLVFAAMIGKKPREDSLTYLQRISAPTHNDADHEFESSVVIPGICRKCGWAHPDLNCSHCGQPINLHAKAYGMVLGFVIVDLLLDALAIELLMAEMRSLSGGRRFGGFGRF